MLRLSISIATLATVVGFLACSQQERLNGGTGGTGGLGGSGSVATGGSFTGDGSAPIAGRGDSGGARDGGCMGVERALEKLRPEVLILLDRSAAMNNDIDDSGCGSSGTAGCGLESKWAIITAGITEGLPVAASYADWGLKLVAGPGSNSCGVSSAPDVPIGSANSDAIAAALLAQTTPEGEVSNGGRAPVALAEADAASYLAGRSGPNPRYIMYIGDTLPNCASGAADPSADDSTSALLAVQQAFATGIPTIVTSIGSLSLQGLAAVDQTMFLMAQQGGQPNYLVSGKTDLVQLLSEVGHKSCTFALGDAAVGDGGSASSLEVHAGGKLLSRDQTHTAGWDYDSPAMASISIYGLACQDIQFGNTGPVTAETCP